MKALVTALQKPWVLVIVCKAGDAKRWSEAIRKMLVNDKLREKNIRNGLERVKQHFLATTMAHKYKTLLKLN